MYNISISIIISVFSNRKPGRALIRTELQWFNVREELWPKYIKAIRIPDEIFEKVKWNNVISLIASSGRTIFGQICVKIVPGDAMIWPPPSPRRIYTIFSKIGGILDNLEQNACN